MKFKETSLLLSLLFTTISYSQNCLCYWNSSANGSPQCIEYSNCGNSNKTSCEDIIANDSTYNGIFDNSNNIDLPLSYTGTFCDFIVTVMLPIDLVDFYAKEETVNFNTITWITASERNNDYFTLYYSSDGVEWHEIELISGAGTSQEKTLYEVMHSPKINQLNYYKLSQTDYDGKTKEFPIISLDNRKSTITKRYNLFGDEVNQNYHGIVIEVNNLGEKTKVLQH